MTNISTSVKSLYRPVSNFSSSYKSRFTGDAGLEKLRKREEENAAMLRKQEEEDAAN